MFREVLYKEQVQNLKILKLFAKDFYLAGGTAIALQLGHRKSIDFDLFSHREIKNSEILKKLQNSELSPSHILVDNKGEEFTCIIGGTKVTFLHYPFEIHLEEENTFESMQLPSKEILGAMKLYTLGRRGKWKDYVDIYFLTKQLRLEKISELAEGIFGGAYNEKLMREQLCYFDDIDYSEEVEYLGESISQKIIQDGLKDIAAGKLEIHPKSL